MRYVPFLYTIPVGDCIAKNSENLDIVYDDVTITLGALAAKDAISSDSKIDAARLQGFRVMKTEYWIDYSGKATGEGPVMVGFSMNHTVGEVEEAFEADPGDRTSIQNAQAKRPVWPLKMIPAHAVQLDVPDKVLGGTFNPRWSCIEGKAAIWWAYNMDSSALTTGTVIRIFAKHFGVWLRD